MTQLILDQDDGAWDAHEQGGGSGFSGTATTVNASSHTTSSVRFIGGIGFTGASAIAGATIDSAYLWVRAQNTSNDDFNFTIYAEDVDVPVSYVADADVLTRLSLKTTAGVLWSADAVGVADRVQSPDIKTVIQEIADRGGFTGTINLLLDGATDAIKAGKILSKEGTASKRPQLEINYTAGGGGGRIMSSLAAGGGLASEGGIVGIHGGLAG